MHFTYESYRKLVEQIIKRGYQITDYHSYESVDKPCILRHDIDMDIKKARVFAEKEKEIENGQVNSTYFVLISSDFYNPFSKENILELRKISRLGNEIGLHFDEKKYMCDETYDLEYLKECVYKEIKILSEMMELPVHTVSMHRPSTQFLNSKIKFKNIINSYDSKFFSQFKYLSDSRRHWRENVDEIVEQAEHEALHILTHPFWYDEKELNLKEELLKFICSGNKKLYENTNINFRNLESVIKLEEI